MGYRPEPKKIHIVFGGDSDYAGFECTVRGQTLGEWFELTGIESVTTGAVVTQLQRFADCIVAWNIEDEKGKPVPVSKKAVYAQDKAMLIAAAEKWMETISGVTDDDPLEASLPDGEPSPEPSIPMEALSENPQS